MRIVIRSLDLCQIENNLRSNCAPLFRSGEFAELKRPLRPVQVDIRLLGATPP
jgi:hypothetical protein